MFGIVMLLMVVGLGIMNMCQACVQPDKLDELALSSGCKTVMFIISHDSNSYEVAKNYSTCHSWMHVISIETTIFFESYVYSSSLPAQAHITMAHDFVVIGTHKTINLHAQRRDEIYRLLSLAKKSNWDIIPFFRGSTSLMKHGVRHHGAAFKLAWDGVLTSAGYSLSTIRDHDDDLPFFKSSFIVRASLLPGLIDFMNRAMHIVRNNQTVAELFDRDSYYSKTASRVKVDVSAKVFGSNIFLHPYVFERLPSFYFNTMGVRVCMSACGLDRSLG